MITFADLIVLALACNLAVETWHHSELFAGCRAYWEAVENWFSELLGCPYCLSHWTSLALCLYYLGVATLRYWPGLPDGWVLVLQSPVIALAVARAAQLLNDFTYRTNRTPNRKEHDITSSDLD